MSLVQAIFDGRVFVPQGPVDLPPGSKLEISFQIPTSMTKTTLQNLLAIAEEFPANPESPPDLAENHDHYLYGTPKKS